MMTPAQRTLFDHLSVFPLDERTGWSAFAQRLARDCGWTPDFTRRVIAEYRRFLLLAATCDHAVAPSPAVDQAWHLHLLFTRSYWEQLCAKVVGQPLHHEPAETPSEAHRRRHDYRATLDAYQRTFDARPPADVWPAFLSPQGASRAEAGSFVAWVLLLSTSTLAAVGLPWLMRHYHPWWAWPLVLITVLVWGLVLLRQVNRPGTSPATGPRRPADAPGGSGDGDVTLFQMASADSGQADHRTTWFDDWFGGDTVGTADVAGSGGDAGAGDGSGGGCGGGCGGGGD